jgi:Nif-specific regulatory protein
LRERKGDIPILADSFLKRFNKENGRNLKLAASAIDVLKACYFPGNVRELENCVFRTATLAPGGSIVDNDFACRHDQCLSSLLWKGSATPLPERPQPMVPLPVAPVRAESKAVRGVAPDSWAGDADREDVGAVPGGDGAERERLIEAMEKAGWVQAKAARILGLTPRQIGYALKKHGIELRHF